jgi:hypothetical protein
MPAMARVVSLELKARLNSWVEARDWSVARVELEGVEEVLVLWIEATLRMSHTIS